MDLGIYEMPNVHTFCIQGLMEYQFKIAIETQTFDLHALSCI